MSHLINISGSGLPTLTFFDPQPVNTEATASTERLNVNTTAIVGAFYLPGPITVNKIHLSVNAVGTSGTFGIGIFSADGATREISVVSPSTSITGILTTTVSSVSLSAGVHYIVIVPRGTVDITINTWLTGSGNGLDYNAPSSEPVIMGTLTVTASTMPSSFDPTAILTSGSLEMPAFRLDN